MSVIEQIGIVVSEEDENLAKVWFRRHSICEACGQCRGPNERIAKISNPIGAREGDWVLVTMGDKSVLRAAAAIYVLPIIFLILGYHFSFRIWQVEWVGIVGGIISMAIVFLAIRFWDKRLADKEKFRPTIVRLAYEEEIEALSRSADKEESR